MEKKMTQAAKWYRMAAEQGHSNSQFNLGAMYFNAEGLAKNDTLAGKWFRKAAEQNHVEAQQALQKHFPASRKIVSGMGGEPFNNLIKDNPTVVNPQPVDFAKHAGAMGAGHKKKSDRVSVVSATMSVIGRPALSQYAFGSNGVVYCSALFKDTFEKAGDSVGIWKIDKDKRVVIQWYNTKNICLPTVNEVLAVDFKSNPPKLQIVEHDDKTQVDSVTKCKIESLGGLPGESAKVWLTGMDSAFQSTHLSLINPSNSLSLLQRREMMKQLDEVETEYNDNQKLAANLVDNPLSSVLFVVPTAKKSSAGK